MQVFLTADGTPLSTAPDGARVSVAAFGRPVVCAIGLPDSAINDDAYTGKVTLTATEAEVLAAVKRWAVLAVADVAEAMADRITPPAPPSERLSWTTKLAAAEAHDADAATAAQTALLTAEAAITGESVDTLAASIITNAATFNVAAGKLAGQRRKTQKAVDAATDIAGVLAALATGRTEAETLLAGLLGE